MTRLDSSESDATIWSVTYDCHSDDSRTVIYAPKVINNAHREHL